MPADSATSAAPSTPVIIIGGGPVGMNLAMNLDALGVRSIIVNADPATRMHPKGSTQNCRTMEHYRRLGLAARIRALGLPSEYPTSVGYFTRVTGWELARIVMPSEGEKRRALSRAAATDQTPEPIFRCNQMYVEALLLAHLKTLRNVELRFGWKCIDFADEGERVWAEIEEADTGRRETLHGRYLAGCDGGQSFVRHKLAIRYGGERPLEQVYHGGPMVNSHLSAPDFYARVGREPFWHYWTVNRDLRTNLVALDGKSEFVLTTKLKTASDKPDPALIARQFHAACGITFDVTFLGHETWTSGYAFVAERFVQGRVFLIGDSVHLFSPTGGFGMNTGIDDAANLGWKLAARLEGWGGPRLLDTYESERKPIATRNTLAARALARNVGDVPVGDAIEQDSREGAEQRSAAGRFLATFGEEFASIGVQLGARYDGSPIVVPDGTTPPPDDPAVYLPSACPGGRAPHFRLEDGASLFDRLGHGFTLLRLGARPADASAIVAAARARAVPLSIVDIGEDEVRDLYERGLALIRPDQHVAWRGDRAPEDSDALIARVTGW